MTKEDKKLLLKDLCARLPYGVIVKDRNGIHKLTVGNTEFTDLFYSNKCNIKPYLRPMSSMTEEEKQVLELCDAFVEPRSIELKVDFYNKQHLDYRGFIEYGLAIAVTEHINPYKEK